MRRPSSSSRLAGSTNGWTTIATVQSSVLGVVPYVETGVGPGTGIRTYTDPIGRTTTQYEYRVYAINVVGDNWNYSDPAFNEILPGSGWPTLTLVSPGGHPITVSDPSGLVLTKVIAKNRTTDEVTLNWTDNSGNEDGFLIQRANNSGFTIGVVNTTVGANVTTFKETVSRGKTYYYRVLAFNATTQSGWSNTVTVTTP